MSEILNDSQKDLRKILEDASLIRDLTDDEINALIEIAEEKRYARGTCIIIEDSKSRDLFVLTKGRATVRLSLPSDREKEEIVYTMRDGQVFGELSLVDGSPRSATIKAEDDVMTYRFDFEKLNNLMNANPRIGFIVMRNVASIISNRMRNTNLLWRNSLIW